MFCPVVFMLCISQWESGICMYMCGECVQVNECKEAAWSLGEELDAMVRAWREARSAAPAVRAPHAPPHRHNEICFKSARWRLTDADGQLGIADLLLTNFLSVILYHYCYYTVFSLSLLMLENS